MQKNATNALILNTKLNIKNIRAFVAKPHTKNATNALMLNTKSSVKNIRVFVANPHARKRHECTNVKHKIKHKKYSCIRGKTSHKKCHECTNIKHEIKRKKYSCIRGKTLKHRLQPVPAYIRALVANPNVYIRAFVAKLLPFNSKITAFEATMTLFLLKKPLC